MMDEDHVETPATALTTTSNESHQQPQTPVKQSQPRKSVEGWIVFATGIPPEAEPEHIESIFSQHGNINSVHLNVDRRTGYLKGYALVEFENFKSAQEAINQLDNTEILDEKIRVDWCFLDPLK